jgi:hypothetical protein
MNFSIVFDNTGDSIPFKSVNTEILEYYVEFLNSNDGNHFECFNSPSANIQQIIAELKQVSIELNQWIPEILDCEILVYSDDEYLDPTNLNQLHADWVVSQTVNYDIDTNRKAKGPSSLADKIHNYFPNDIRFPTIDQVIDSIGKTTQYQQINVLVHKLEVLFNLLTFQSADKFYLCTNNVFDKQKVLTNDFGNLRMMFMHSGRSRYDKFTNFDRQFADENTYDQLIGYVSLHLIQPETVPFSNEYISWCQQVNKPPLGERLNFGNIPDIQSRLKDYRVVVLRNLSQYNKFSIQLSKG